MTFAAWANPGFSKRLLTPTLKNSTIYLFRHSVELLIDLAGKGCRKDSKLLAAADCILEHHETNVRLLWGKAKCEWGPAGYASGFWR